MAMRFHSWVPALMITRGETPARTARLLIDVEAGDETAMRLVSIRLACIEPLQRADDLLSTKVLLGGGSHRSGSTIHIRSSPIPETVAQMARGRRLSCIVDDPFMGDGVVEHVLTGEGRSTVRVDLVPEVMTTRDLAHGGPAARLLGPVRRRLRPICMLRSYGYPHARDRLDGLGYAGLAAAVWAALLAGDADMRSSPLWWLAAAAFCLFAGWFGTTGSMAARLSDLSEDELGLGERMRRMIEQASVSPFPWKGGA